MVLLNQKQKWFLKVIMNDDIFKKSICIYDILESLNNVDQNTFDNIPFQILITQKITQVMKIEELYMMQSQEIR